MSESLSPQAQAVLDATDYPEDWATRIRVACALRAAADSAPAPDLHEEDAFHAGFWAAIEHVRSIAAELDPTTGTSGKDYDHD